MKLFGSGQGGGFVLALRFPRFRDFVHPEKCSCVTLTAPAQSTDRFSVAKSNGRFQVCTALKLAAAFGGLTTALNAPPSVLCVDQSRCLPGRSYSSC